MGVEAVGDVGSAMGEMGVEMASMFSVMVEEWMARDFGESRATWINSFGLFHSSVPVEAGLGVDPTRGSATGATFEISFHPIYRDRLGLGAYLAGDVAFAGGEIQSGAYYGFRAGARTHLGARTFALLGDIGVERIPGAFAAASLSGLSPFRRLEVGARLGALNSLSLVYLLSSYTASDFDGAFSVHNVEARLSPGFMLRFSFSADYPSDVGRADGGSGGRMWTVGLSSAMFSRRMN